MMKRRLESLFRIFGAPSTIWDNAYLSVLNKERSTVENVDFTVNVGQVGHQHLVSLPVEDMEHHVESICLIQY